MNGQREAAHHERFGKNVVIRLRKDEIKYRVDFTTWKSAQGMEDTPAKFEAQTDEENADWMDEVICDALADIKRKLRAYVPERTRLRTNGHEDGEEWVVSLVMEHGWMGDAEELGNAMGRYVVDKVLHEWYLLTLPDMAANYAERMDEDLRKMMDVARDVDIDGVNFML